MVFNSPSHARVTLPWIFSESQSTIISRPLDPRSRMRCCFLGSRFQGVSKSMPHCASMANSWRPPQEPLRSLFLLKWLRHGMTAPWRMERPLSGISLSISILNRLPMPLHSGHMPKGELNEKSAGCSSG